jgi:hypothetical protein
MRLGSKARLTLLGLALLLLLAGPAAPGNAQFHGVVIDAETKAPIVDAVVVAVWLRRPVIRMDGPAHFHDARETMTDIRGAFALDASPRIDWNPFTTVAPPRIVIRAPGYLEFPLGYERLRRVAPEAWWAADEALRKRMHVAIELPRLRDREEGRAFADRAGELLLVPLDHVPRYMFLLNRTRIELGLEPL